MTRILIRSGMSPFDTFDETHIIANNSIGTNVGNLIYQYSIFRTLMTEGTTITPDYYDYDPKRADEINENYDIYVIPLADAFRSEFVPTLRKFTKLIKKLTIPVVVIGVGLRAPFEPKLNEGFPYDEDVKAFVSAVLEKSNIIGLRGQITSDYLTRLGFKEGVDHTVIGCPSMYTFGRELNIRETNITPDSLVSVNSSLLSPKNVLDFITRSAEQFPNHYFIPQLLKELKLTYTGAPGIVEKKTDNYPSHMSDPMYMNNRVKFFLNVPTWYDFLREVDFSFGARLHGNIAATLSGTPSIMIPKDARMRELADYHNLTSILANEITDSTNMLDLIHKVDFQLPTKSQARNFDNFIDFLNKNNLNHIYKDSLTPTSIPLDEAIKKVDFLPASTPISGCSMDEIVARFEKYYPVMNKKDAARDKSQKAKIAEQEKTIKKLQGTINKQKGQLNRKSVRLALKTANIFGSNSK